MLEFLLPAMAAFASAPDTPQFHNPCSRPEPLHLYISQPNCDAVGYWAGKAYHIKTNSFGARDTEISPKGKTPRILFVGSSELYGPALENSELPTVTVKKDLEKALGRKIEVVNASMEGYSTVQHLVNFEREYLDRYQPDFVVYTISNTAIRMNMLHRVMSRELDGRFQLFLFPSWMNPLLDWWPSGARAFYKALTEGAWLYVTLRESVLQALDRSDAFETTANYVNQMRLSTEKRGIPFLSLYYRPVRMSLQGSFRVYSQSGWLQSFLNFVSPDPQLDGTLLGAAVLATGTQHYSFTHDESRWIFNLSGQTDPLASHPDANAAARFGEMMAKYVLAWKNGPARRDSNLRQSDTVTPIRQPWIKGRN